MKFLSASKLRAGAPALTADRFFSTGFKAGFALGFIYLFYLAKRVTEINRPATLPLFTFHITLIIVIVIMRIFIRVTDLNSS
jgi:hypothetical protein